MNDMLNVDKYRKEIIDYMNKDRFSEGLDCKIAALRGLRNCENCECDVCLRASLEWLLSEYEQPLLENGDGLKPGDWIMVSKDDGKVWSKERFVGYLDGMFFCKIPLRYDSFIVEGYIQARLPEEGE